MKSQAQRKHQKEMKRKAKRKSLKLAHEKQAVDNRAENRAKREAYKAKVAEHNRLINLKLKRALGIPDEEEVSTEKLVQAMNLRIKMDKEKALAKENQVEPKE